MAGLADLFPSDRRELRQWLEENIQAAQFPVWLAIYKKSSGKQTLSYDEVLEEATCFGLVDTQTKTIDKLRYAICPRRRKAGGNWTEANKKIAQDMINQGRMTDLGRKVFSSQNE